MKKLWIGILSILMVMSCMTGCFFINGNQNSGSYEEPISQSSKAESTDSSIEEEVSSSEDFNVDSDSSATSDSSVGSDDSSAESAPSSGTVVPPITDGGNFDGTV